MINTIIIDKEQKHTEYLYILLQQHFPEIETIKVCDNVPAAINAVAALKPQLVFANTELVPYTAFDLIEQLAGANIDFILTSDHNKYAAKAFQKGVIDFIEKPFGLTELQLAINKYKAKRAGKTMRQNFKTKLPYLPTDVPVQTIGVPVNGGIDFIDVSEIILCKSKDNHTDFYLKGKHTVTANKTLKWVEALMLGHNFFRVHDSYLINLNHIKKYKKGAEGGLLELTEHLQAEVSRRRKGLFLKTLSDLKIIMQ